MVAKKYWQWEFNKVLLEISINLNYSQSIDPQYLQTRGSINQQLDGRKYIYNGDTKPKEKKILRVFETTKQPHALSNIN